MTLTVRVRPNRLYLLIMVMGVVALAWSVVQGGPLGVVGAASSGLVLAILSYPVLVSTVFRVPVIVIGDGGIRLPLMGVNLPWEGVSSTAVGAHPRRLEIPPLLIFPVDTEHTLRQVRPWLRREARGDIARYGSPIALLDLSLDHSVDDIAAAIALRLHPGAGR
ncbi:hypothetical protein I6A60_34875 [Frankia sp. AgB1.9]|uniref:hypothetical protein n=1 Tax=unclassified Frankia TaxID=2632575 RepID=UPI001932F00D|nr:MULTISPECIES: hypothetical protein [unclassified Frankia]MBL7493679.1 hypothetical protein [Frankia sp. AgW1.1]MBL7552998.1 hypothetical protein [Frankia sp. AgB1.9]MBL7624583.1 hypothetical protein [Frankia sp. AgB1.8]